MKKAIEQICTVKLSKGEENSMDKKSIKEKATEILKNIFGQTATFREGQYEAIEATLTNKRTIVVQRTGWGKSLVYFISAKMTDGVTIIISPLLVLMDNQKQFAEKLNLKCAIVNSTVKGDERAKLLEDIRQNKYDVIFTTPETLYGKEMSEIIPDLNIGLFVIDECHCISDWGHDFRLEYGRLYQIIAELPERVSVLGTTATANDRVVEDLKKQFGQNVAISRGTLTRETLHIEILQLETKAERYAWLKKNLKKLPGSGIIYCLTRKDCQNLSDYLNENGISARPYYSDNAMDLADEDTGKSINEETEELFLNNQIKVIVATIKLGMGYDKDDIRFIIHFQKPSSLVAYYQQIGRAGRKQGMEAYCYLMTCKEDRAIAEYFIESAFPTEEQERNVIIAFEKHSSGLSLTELARYSNISTAALKKTINMLFHNGMIYYENKKYYRSIEPYVYPREYYDSVKRAKYAELDAMDSYIDTQECLSKYVVNSLNDNEAHKCGKCKNCLGQPIFEGIEMPTRQETEEIQERMNSLYLDIKPRKNWPYKNALDNNTKIAVLNEPGIALAKYGEAGYGEMVAYDKYHAAEFREELIDKAVAVLKDKLAGQDYVAVTNVPSSRNTKVAVFAKKVAQRLGLQYTDVLEKIPGQNEKQKSMQNSHFQCKNALDSLRLKDNAEISGKIILIDDMVDSKWTLTVCGRLLTKAGAEGVFPFCLADSSVSGD